MCVCVCNCYEMCQYKYTIDKYVIVIFTHLITSLFNNVYTLYAVIEPCLHVNYKSTFCVLVSR